MATSLMRTVDSKLAVVAALVGNLVIALAKLGAGWVSGSTAMIAEAAHSFSDVGNQVLLLLGIKRSGGAPSERHPFGTGKAAYFWPFMVAVLLFGGAGTFSLLEGIEKVRHPHGVDDIGVSLGILGLAFLIEAMTLTVAFRAAHRGAREAGAKDVRSYLRMNRDATVLTVLVEDALALAGLPIAALALVLTKVTGNGVWDGVGSIAIGVMLMGFALFLGREVHGLLLGRGLRKKDLVLVQAVVAADPDAVALREVRSMHLSPEAAFLGADVAMRPGLSRPEALEALRRLEAELVRTVPILRFVYLEPHS